MSAATKFAGCLVHPGDHVGLGLQGERQASDGKLTAAGYSSE